MIWHAITSPEIARRLAPEGKETITRQAIYYRKVRGLLPEPDAEIMTGRGPQPMWKDETIQNI